MIWNTTPLFRSMHTRFLTFLPLLMPSTITKLRNTTVIVAWHNFFSNTRKMIIMRGEPSLMHDVSEFYYNIQGDGSCISQHDEIISSKISVGKSCAVALSTAGCIVLSWLHGSLGCTQKFPDPCACWWWCRHIHPSLWKWRVLAQGYNNNNSIIVQQCTSSREDAAVAGTFQHSIHPIHFVHFLIIDLSILLIIVDVWLLVP